jgi:acetylornithine/N-succinyldiaminopimelate aminotransferase
MVVAYEAVDEIAKPQTLDNVREVAGYFTQQLNGLKDQYPDIIVDVRGRGLLIGIKLIPNNRDFMVLARDQKLLVAGGGDNCVRLLPPLTLTIEEAQEAVAKIGQACEVARQHAKAKA